MWAAMLYFHPWKTWRNTRSTSTLETSLLFHAVFTRRKWSWNTSNSIKLIISTFLSHQSTKPTINTTSFSSSSSTSFSSISSGSGDTGDHRSLVESWQQYKRLSANVASAGFNGKWPNVYTTHSDVLQKYAQVTIGKDSRSAYSSKRMLQATSAFHHMGCHSIIHIAPCCLIAHLALKLLQLPILIAFMDPTFCVL